MTVATRIPDTARWYARWAADHYAAPTAQTAASLGGKMAKLDLMQFAASEVPEGETAISAVKANWNGMVPPSPVATGIAALAQGTGPDGLEGAPDPDKIVTFPSARQIALVL